MKLQNFIRLDDMDAWSSQMTKQTKSAINKFIENVHSMYIWESIQHSTFLDEQILWKKRISSEILQFQSPLNKKQEV